MLSLNSSDLLQKNSNLIAMNEDSSVEFPTFAKVKFHGGLLNQYYNCFFLKALNCATIQKTNQKQPVDFKTLYHSFTQSHPPLSSSSVNMSGEEHKKGRASELEGQQQAFGRAMFLLSEPQREGVKKEQREGA